jgi:hypothetical protein
MRRLWPGVTRTGFLFVSRGSEAAGQTGDILFAQASVVSPESGGAGWTGEGRVMMSAALDSSAFQHAGISALSNRFPTKAL